MTTRLSTAKQVQEFPPIPEVVVPEDVLDLPGERLVGVCVVDGIEEFSVSAPDAVILLEVVTPNVAVTQYVVDSSSSEATVHQNFDDRKCKW